MRMPESENLPAKPKPRLRLRKRNELIRAAVRPLQAVAPHVAERQYVLLARDFCRMDFMIDRMFAELYDKPLINPETGELRNSLDLLRRMMDSRRALARELGLSPTIPSLAKPVRVL